MSKFERLANDLFKLDDVGFEQLERCMRDILKRHEFQETAHITFSDAGIPAGNISRQAFYSPDLQVVVVIELSQDWDDYYNHETDQIEYRDYYHYRIYVYDLEEPFDNNSLYFLGDYERNNLMFYYSTNNFDELYYED